MCFTNSDIALLTVYFVKKLIPSALSLGFQASGAPSSVARSYVLCDTVAGTPADDAHAGRTALAVPDLVGPFPETVLLSHHSCF